MNSDIERKICQAELEYILLDAWNASCRSSHRAPFQEWIEYQIGPDSGFFWKDECNELLNLYQGT